MRTQQYIQNILRRHRQQLFGKTILYLLYLELTFRLFQLKIKLVSIDVKSLFNNPTNTVTLYHTLHIIQLRSRTSLRVLGHTQYI